MDTLDLIVTTFRRNGRVRSSGNHSDGSFQILLIENSKLFCSVSSEDNIVFLVEKFM